MKKFLYLILALAFLSCSTEPESPEKPLTDKLDENQIEGIQTLFDEVEFENPKMKELLMELNLCTEKTEDTLDYDHPSCSPKFFKFFQLNEQIPIENGFILQIKSKVSGFPLRRLLVFVRERGELVKVNGIIANLIGIKKSKSGYHDLILRFNDNVDGEPTFYNCFFSWDGVKYDYKSVEVIEGANWGGPVKAEFKDSMNLEIKKTLSNNKMFF